MWLIIFILVSFVIGALVGLWASEYNNNEDGFTINDISMIIEDMESSLGIKFVNDSDCSFLHFRTSAIVSETQSRISLSRNNLLPYSPLVLQIDWNKNINPSSLLYHGRQYRWKIEMLNNGYQYHYSTSINSIDYWKQYRNDILPEIIDEIKSK